MKQEAL